MLSTWSQSYCALGPSMVADFTAGAMHPGVTFSRSGTATRVNASGLVEVVSANLPRIDYDPVTLACKGLLIEEQRTNLLTYSEQFDNAVWAKTRSSVTADVVTAPSGTATAYKLVEDATVSNTHQLSITIAASASTTYTASVYAKAGELTGILLAAQNSPSFSNVNYVKFDLVAGTVISGGGGAIQHVGNGWYRCSISGTTEAGTTGYVFRSVLLDGANEIYTGDGVSGLYIWGAQLEAGAFPTSYIPTTASAVTRGADVASMTGANFSSWYRQDEGTLFCESQSVPTTTLTGIFNHHVTISNGTIQTYIGFISSAGYSAGGNNISVVNGGSSQLSFSGGLVTGYNRFAVACAQNNAAASINGSLSTDGVFTMPSVNSMKIGGSAAAGNTRRCHIRRLAYFPRRLSNTELVALTA